MGATLMTLLGLLTVAKSLDNGQGRVPAMGFSSWNSFGADYSSDMIKNITKILVDSGLAAKGYRYINCDEGWLAARDSNGRIVENRTKFPEGMQALGQWITSQDRGNGETFQFGLYSSRGTCQCSEPDYSGPGSQGYEAVDIDWMINYANASFLKLDSCCGSQDHATAIAQYGLWRDLLNATGKPVLFSACGWFSWYSIPDPSIGYPGLDWLANEARIAGDGDTWYALTNCINVANRVNKYAGPGAFNDPDLLIGPHGIPDGTYATELQSRTQVNMWSVIAAPLIISDNLMEASAYQMESYGNVEVIAVDQDPLGIPGKRLVGPDLFFPCTTPPDEVPYTALLMACDMTDPLQKWTATPTGNADGSVTLTMDVDGQTVTLANWGCNTTAATPLYGLTSPQACGAAASQWVFGAQSVITNVLDSTLCLDAYRPFGIVGPAMDTWPCNGGDEQAWTLLPDGRLRLNNYDTDNSWAMCVTIRPAPTTCTNVWARPLMDGSQAFIFLNNDGNRNLTVTCDSDCFQDMGFNGTTAPRGLAVRDLWAHAIVANISAPFTFSATVQGGGGSNIYRAIPL